jgi:hypothetical protein
MSVGRDRLKVSCSVSYCGEFEALKVIAWQHVYNIDEPGNPLCLQDVWESPGFSFRNKNRISAKKARKPTGPVFVTYMKKG